VASDLLTIFGFLAALSVLLYVLARLDQPAKPRTPPAHRADRANVRH
jgi:hypothetical protein